MAAKKKSARKSTARRGTAKRAASKRKTSTRSASKSASKRSSSSTALRSRVRSIMREFKSGNLHSGSRRGPTVRSRKQATAIALSEAGASRGRSTRKSPKRRSR